jgi:hypothetical protein
MKPLETVYWLRLALGILAGFLSLGYAFGTHAIPSTDPTIFFNSAMLAIVVYILSYYYIKSKFAAKVQKTQKLVTAGIGIYFLAWIVCWALLYTLFAG